MNKLSVLFLLIVVGCSSPHADNYQTGETEEEVVSLFNDHEYSKAVWLIENRHGKLPADVKMQFLLAEAYLGKSGVEPLAFAVKISNAQDLNPNFFPHCPMDQISSLHEADMKCILKRAYAVGPPADQKDFKRARELFRLAYPNAAASPAWVNTIIGMVETLSFVNRAGDLYLYAKGVQAKGNKVNFNELDIPWLRNQGNQSVEEANQAISRAQYSGEKVARLLGAARESDWFDGAEFAKATGLPGLLDFIHENLTPSDDIRYGGLLEKLKELLASQEKEGK